jgi:hypothetical protein
LLNSSFHLLQLTFCFNIVEKLFTDFFLFLYQLSIDVRPITLTRKASAWQNDKGKQISDDEQCLKQAAKFSDDMEYQVLHTSSYLFVLVLWHSTSQFCNLVCMFLGSIRNFGGWCFRCHADQEQGIHLGCCTWGDSS